MWYGTSTQKLRKKFERRKNLPKITVDQHFNIMISLYLEVFLSLGRVFTLATVSPSTVISDICLLVNIALFWVIGQIMFIYNRNFYPLLSFVVLVLNKVGLGEMGSYIAREVLQCYPRKLAPFSPTHQTEIKWVFLRYSWEYSQCSVNEHLEELSRFLHPLSLELTASWQMEHSLWPLTLNQLLLDC